MNYYNFFSEHTKAYNLRVWFLGILKYTVIFVLSFALSFFLIYNAKFNESDEVKKLNDEILNIQIDNVKKFYEEEKKAQSNIDKAEQNTENINKE